METIVRENHEKKYNLNDRATMSPNVIGESYSRKIFMNFILLCLTFFRNSDSNLP